MDKNTHIVISLGGSLIVPNEIDVAFLKSFVETIKIYADNGYKFFIITGGGKIARRFQDAAKSITDVTNDDLDWLGIASLRLNAELLRVCFGDYVHKDIILNTAENVSFDKPIIIGAAYKPGSSTDLSAVKAANAINAKKVINLSNIDFAYDKDPNKHPDAKKLENVSWTEYRSYIPTQWQPGLSTPFDPIASQYAQEFGLEVAIMNGNNIENLKDYIDGKEFIGTIIS